MKNLGKVYIIFFLSWIAMVFSPAFGQESKDGQNDLVQLSGLVLNEYLETLPFVHIIIKNKNRGTYTDKDGMYSLVVKEGDTVLFTYVGYKTQGIVIPDTVQDNQYLADVLMISDTVAIGEVIILPWKTYEEFKQAFKEVEIAEDDLERARKNIALIKTQIIMSNSPDPKLNYNYVMQQQYEQTFIQGQFPAIPILNPQNWAEFFKALQEGDFIKNK